MAKSKTRKQEEKEKPKKERIIPINWYFQDSTSGFMFFKRK